MVGIQNCGRIVACYPVLNDKYRDWCFRLPHEKDIVTQAQAQDEVQLSARTVADFCLSNRVTGETTPVCSVKLYAAVFRGDLPYLAGRRNHIKSSPSEKLRNQS